jgi:hypothetical protein
MYEKVLGHRRASNISEGFFEGEKNSQKMAAILRDEDRYLKLSSAANRSLHLPRISVRKNAPTPWRIFTDLDIPPVLFLTSAP